MSLDHEPWRARRAREAAHKPGTKTHAHAKYMGTEVAKRSSLPPRAEPRTALEPRRRAIFLSRAEHGAETAAE